MHILADYFLMLEDPECKMNHLDIKTTISWHDMDELETGDKISWKKTLEDIAKELTAWKDALIHIPELLQEKISLLIEQYESKSTDEAKFVKAIDKFEPLVHMLDPLGRARYIGLKIKFNLAESHKIPHIKPFPYMNRFMTVIHQEMRKQGYFAD